MSKNKSDKEWREEVAAKFTMEEMKEELEKPRQLRVRFHRCPTMYSDPYTSSYSSFMSFFETRRNAGDPPLVIWVKEIIDGEERIHKGQRWKSGGDLKDSYNSFSLTSDEHLTSTTWKKVNAMWEVYAAKKYEPVLAD